MGQLGVGNLRLPLFLVALSLAACGPLPTFNAKNQPAGATTSISTKGRGSLAQYNSYEKGLLSKSNYYPQPVSGPTFDQCPDPTGLKKPAPLNPVQNGKVAAIARSWLSGKTDKRLALSDPALWDQIELWSQTGPNSHGLPAISAAQASKMQMQFSTLQSATYYTGCFQKVITSSILITVCNIPSPTVQACDPGLSMQFYLLDRAGKWLIWRVLV